jgi:hypothetical protein
MKKTNKNFLKKKLSNEGYPECTSWLRNVARQEKKKIKKILLSMVEKYLNS